MDKFRGYEIYEKEEEKWYFSDTNKPTATTHMFRPCGHCGLENTPDGHDGCLSNLPGVKNACCGHGEREQSYIQFTNGVTVRGFTLDKNVEEPPNIERGKI